MDLRIFTEPQQGATYDDLLARGARPPRSSASTRFFRSDHYLAMGRRRHARARPTPGSPSPAWPATPSTHPARHAGHARPRSGCPGRSRSASRSVDQMSGGRVELGLGAGWFDAGARRLRHPLPAARRALRPARGAARRHHRPVGDAAGRDLRPRGRALPDRRLARRCPSRCSAGGRRSSSAAAASAARPRSPPRYAAEFNVPFASGRADRRLVRAGRGPPAREAGRDPATLVYSAAQVAVLRQRRRRGAPPRRRDRPRRRRPAPRTASPARRPRSSTGSAGYAEAGATALYLQVLDLADLDHLADVREAPVRRSA